MKPPRLPGPSLPWSKGPAAGPKRLIVLVAMLMVFVLGYGLLRVEGERRREDLPQAEPIFPDGLPQIVREPAARVDPARLAAVRDESRVERLQREPEPYTHLLSEARKLTQGDLEALGLERLDAAAVIAAPAAHRGRPFEVKGTLRSLEVVAGDSYQEIRGTLQDRDGRLVGFTVLQEPRAEVGDVVRVPGFFFKLMAVEVEPGRYEDPVVWLVGRALIRSFFDLDPTADLGDAPLHRVRDFDASDMLDLQEEVLYHVLNFARTRRSTGDAGVGGASPALDDVEEVSWADLRREPERFRGRPVRLLLRHVEGFDWQRPLGPGGENPLDVDLFHEGILVEGQDRLVRWIGLEPLPAAAIGDHGLVHVTAVFFKNLAWESTRGLLVNGPMVVPLRFEPFRMPEDNVSTLVGAVVGTITGVMLLAIVLSVFADRRGAIAFQRDYLRRRKRRLAEAMQAAAAEGGAPPDPPGAAGRGGPSGP